MYKQNRRLVFYLVNIFSGTLFVLLTLFLIPTDSFWLITIVTAYMFTTGIYACTVMDSRLTRRMENRVMHEHETGIMNTFLDALRFAYTEDEFIQVVQRNLEDIADSSVLYVDRSTNYIVYNSPTRITSSEETIVKLEQNFPKTWN
ncbi:MAG: hypothetical protein MJ178_08265, partial [Treponemataceae bacterium]|nr:hypothetical protein [Treponemataceae bacterium]